MRKGLTFLPAIALAAALALPGVVNAAPHANSVVATVNGEDITLGHMIIAHEALPQQYKQLPPDVLYKAILDQLIQQTALKQELHGEVPAHVQLTVDNEMRTLLAQEVVQNVMEKAATEEKIRATYDETYATGEGSDEFNASHILVESEAEAAEIKKELDAGADFATLAKARSTGPSGPNGGELGWFGLGQMVPEFETAVLDLSNGEVSEPVQTQFGWHVILLTERRKTEAPEYEVVREQISNALRQSAVESHVDALTTKADILRPEIEDLSPEIIKDLSLIRN
ncbi:peptidylprolyl isomerase [Epibacterium sp. SM1979]|uniref:Parvulin-like PPIase n=1 Tax=Tritonibacter litoralis TaxID=2662264 RepID=A0A843YAC0_9RHOB|nr:peptidylprolyl isomerase [Tritonibacter litoralis]MQQ08260.1 peptidylprolyl isomerase [Tritonibacter litoralis]